MLDNTPFAQYSNIIDFIMAVLERSDYVYVPPTGNYRTRLELVTIRSMELIEDIFLGNSEEVLEKYTM